jgi:protein-S-isoprenylcysteine O-methyltransferase Ste14
MRVRRILLASLTIGATLLWLALAAAAWGGWAGLLAHPARTAAAASALALAVVGAASPFSLSSGKRADLRDLWIMPVGAIAVVLLAYLPAYCDRRGLWVIDGDPVRWAGVCLFIAGGALRLWPIFVLGHRFSAVVAIQEEHALVTTGPYRWIRNPSYLGGLLNGAGWALVFRSVLGVLVVGVLAGLIVPRIRAEESLLTSEFGAEYDAYRRRTWRLVPGLY